MLVLVDNCTCGIMAFPCVKFPWLRNPFKPKKSILMILQTFSASELTRLEKPNMWHQQVFLSIVKLGPFALMLILKLFFIFQGKSAGQSSPVCQDVRNFRISLTLPMTCNFWDFFMTDQTRRYYHSSSFFSNSNFSDLILKKTQWKTNSQNYKKHKREDKKIQTFIYR